jgi:hypothetical protein
MPKPKKDKLPDEEALTKKSTRKAAIIFSIVVGTVFAIIWFGKDFLATEALISQANLSLDGKSRILKFSEKASAPNRKNDEVDLNAVRHYGYFLELVDASSNTSLHKIKFKSPGDEIQSTPQLVPDGNGNVWIISTTNSPFLREPGFILKFSLKGDVITKVDFVLDDRYSIRKVMGRKVILSESGSTQGHNNVEGGIYLDLESGKVVR